MRRTLRSATRPAVCVCVCLCVYAREKEREMDGIDSVDTIMNINIVPHTCIFGE